MEGTYYHPGVYRGKYSLGSLKHYFILNLDVLDGNRTLESISISL